MVHSSAGVPQSSVLKPLLFILFTDDLEKLVMRHNFRSHQYADDIQINDHCKKENSLELEKAFSECLDDVAVWIEANHLKLNVSKTEFIWFSNGRNFLRFPRRPVRIVADSIIFSKNVKYLCVWLEETLSFKNIN